MTSNANTLVNKVDKRLDYITKYPGMYSMCGELQVIEALAIQLLEFRSMVGRPCAYEAHPEEVQTLWWQFIANKAKANGQINSPLFILYSMVDIDEFGKIIAECVEYIKINLPLEG